MNRDELKGVAYFKNGKIYQANRYVIRVCSIQKPISFPPCECIGLSYLYRGAFAYLCNQAACYSLHCTLKSGHAAVVLARITSLTSVYFRYYSHLRADLCIRILCNVPINL